MEKYLIYNRTKHRKTITMILLIFLGSYLIYQIMSGDRGLFALFKLSEKRQVLEKNISNLEKEKSNIGKKVNMLKSDSLNLDLLDEQVRRKLGHVKEKEIIYLD